MSRRDVYLPAMIGLLLFGFAVFSYGAMRENQDRLERATGSVEDCEDLVSKIGVLKAAPKLAALEAESSTWLGERIQAASETVGIPQTSVVRVEPQPSVRLGRSQYRVTPTRIQLQGITLKDVVRFAGALIDEGNGLTVRDLDLSRSNRQNPPVERWDAELTLTQLVFSPTTR